MGNLGEILQPSLMRKQQSWTTATEALMAKCDPDRNLPGPVLVCRPASMGLNMNMSVVVDKSCRILLLTLTVRKLLEASDC